MFAHKPGCVNHRAIILYVVCRSVFWDLYCAASERRETCEHSSEAKAFHDYVSTHLAISSVQICARSAACSLWTAERSLEKSHRIIVSECGEVSRSGKLWKDDKLVVHAGGDSNDVIHLRSSWLAEWGHLDLCSLSMREKEHERLRLKGLSIK